MNKQNIYFTILIAISGIFSLLILYKFIIVLLLAYIFATLLRPIYRNIENYFSKAFIIRKFSNGAAALVTTLLFVLIIILPITAILSKVVVDAQSVYVNVVNGSINLDFIEDRISSFVNQISPSVDINFNKIAESVSGFFVSNIGGLFTGTVDLVLKIFLFLLSMFYFLKDGKKFKELYSVISPLKIQSENKIFLSIKNSINSVIIGSLTIAVVQGIFTGLGLWAFGVPNPFFFGTLAGFLALVPGVGPSLVWFPAAVYLFFTKPDSFVWLYQIVWGVLAIGLVDNFLGPKVMNKGINIHELFILLSIIGGILVFGPEGLLLGPLILSVFVSIIKIWNEDKNLL
jgi:predicted PurR-regulated permease PerM